MKKIKIKLFKITSIILLIVLTFGHSMPMTMVFAEDVVAPEAPAAPSAPVAPTTPDVVVTSPSAPVAPTTPEVVVTSPILPTAPDLTMPVLPQAPVAPNTNNDSNTNNTTGSSTGGNNSGSGNGGHKKSKSETPVSQLGQTPPSDSNNINTGSATNTGVVGNIGNNNYSSGVGSGTDGGLSVSNSGNGYASDNSGSASVSDSSNTNQNNNANVDNNLNLDTNTGNNKSNGNVGSTLIQTGDANTSGTIINSLNNNVDGVTVSEFNVADDHVGDIVLDFGANCISGCNSGGVSAANSGNGAKSNNDSQVSETNTDNTFQNNDATIGNTLVLGANSGSNKANGNTGGDSSIITGDANVSGNVLTFANNNIAGNVVYGVVNIYGDLQGDIIFPEEQFNCCGSANLTADNFNNGKSSNNTASASQTNNSNTTQGNNAAITNNLTLNGTTGDNKANYNTGGDSTVQTGDTNVQANVLNVANNNLEGGNMWLVLINEAGKWVGKLVGGDGNMAASDGTTLTMGPDGQIIASNNGNGANSNNNASSNSTNNNNLTQNNNANIVNNVNLTANTGGNSTSANTGGNNSIQTGDAQIIANMVNFVNNNISGNGKIFVTVVNVFGSWVGDFITPGSSKQVKSNSAVNNAVNAGDNQNNSSSNNSPQSSNNQSNRSDGAETIDKAKIEAFSEGIVKEATSNSHEFINGLIAGAKSEVNNSIVQGASSKTVVSQKLKVNLAFLILLLPLAILWFIRKRISRIYTKLLSILL